MDEKRPRYLLDDSIIGSNPGITMTYYLSGLNVLVFSSIFGILSNYFLNVISRTSPKVISCPSVHPSIHPQSFFSS